MSAVEALPWDRIPPIHALPDLVQTEVTSGHFAEKELAPREPAPLPDEIFFEQAGLMTRVEVHCERALMLEKLYRILPAVFGSLGLHAALVEALTVSEPTTVIAATSAAVYAVFKLAGAQLLRARRKPGIGGSFYIKNTRTIKEFKARLRDMHRQDRLSELPVSDFLLQAEFLSGLVMEDEILDACENLEKQVKKFQALAKKQPDKLKILKKIIQSQGWYQVHSSYLTRTLTSEHAGNCEARTKYIIAIVEQVYPDMPLRVQLSGDHSQAIMEVDEKWYDLNSFREVPMTRADFAGTVTHKKENYILDYIWEGLHIERHDPAPESQTQPVPRKSDKKRTDSFFGLGGGGAALKYSGMSEFSLQFASVKNWARPLLCLALLGISSIAIAKPEYIGDIGDTLRDNLGYKRKLTLSEQVTIWRNVQDRMNLGEFILVNEWSAEEISEEEFQRARKKVTDIVARAGQNSISREELLRDFREDPSATGSLGKLLLEGTGNRAAREKLLVALSNPQPENQGTQASQETNTRENSSS